VRFNWQINVKFDLNDEENLLNAIKNGDQEAWEFVTRQLYVPIYNFILSMVRHPENAQELVQDVFMNFWIKKDQIVINTSLKSYLYKAARNHTLNFIKRAKFEASYQRTLAQSFVSSKNDTEERFQYNQLEKSLSQAIDQLPEKCREVFLMSRFYDMSYKEIAETLDLPIRNVHYLIGLALKDLREKLKHYNSAEISVLAWLLPLYGLQNLLCDLAV
jgi:RNA polymerase sigma-70 factor (ECF subfamily)